MEELETTPPVRATDASGASRAGSLARVLELLGVACGVHLEARAAWQAAAEGLASGRDDALRSLGLAARRAGLRLGPCDLRGPDPARQLLDEGAPVLTWQPSPEGGRWIVLQGLRGGLLSRGRGDVELVIVDSTGERRGRLRFRELRAWLGEDSPWLRCEPQLPLATIESRTGSTARRRRPQDSAGTLGPVRRLVELARLERSELGVVLVYAVAIGALSLAVPVAAQALVNTVAFGTVLQPLVVLTILLASCLGFVAVLRVLQALVVEALQRRLFVRVAADFGRRLTRLAGAARREHHGPELANRFFDMITLQKAGASLLIDGLALALQMAVGMVLLAFYHPILLAFDLALLLAVAVVVLGWARAAVSTSLTESTRKYALAGWLEDLAASPLRFGDGPARAFADARTEVLIREWLQARREHFARVIRQLGGGIGLQVLATTALLGIGGWLVIRRQLTLGQLVAAELVVAAIGAGLGKLGKQLESFYDATSSAAKLGKVVDLPLERRGGQLLGGEGPIAVHVGLRDAPEQPPLVELEAGAKRGILGRSAGHSELVDALFGLDGEPSSRFDLRLDGRPINDLDLEVLRAQLALVREVELVTAPLIDNLCPPSIPGDSAQLHEILELVGLRERVATLPEGLHTPLLPAGWPLREAEARRLALARALLRRPRLLLIDGGLDGLALDDEARARLLDVLFAPDAPWTLLLITDDPRLLERCPAGARPA